MRIRNGIGKRIQFANHKFSRQGTDYCFRRILITLYHYSIQEFYEEFCYVDFLTPVLKGDLVPVARQNMLPEGVVGNNAQPRRRRVKVRRPLALQLPPLSLQTPMQPLQSPSQSLQTHFQSIQSPSASLQAPLQPLASLQAPTATPFELRPENRPFQVNETVGSKPEFAKRCELSFAHILSPF